MNNIVLIGMPGSGKSTIGVILAKRLGYDFVDTDNLISDREKTTLQDIIDKKGVSEFLKIEGIVGEELNIDNTVIATGGSMVFSDSAMKNLLKDSKCVFIDVPLPEIKRRVKNIDTRGIAMEKDDTLDTLYEKRMPKYREYADITVEVKQNSKIDNVVSKILDMLK
ncbi:MAG: shikimate kinase [Ruminococcus sp.]|nr:MULTISPECIES: shikimate kinase [Ruminococcus]MCI5599510.1 shikimate kinase [Ruminococcus sp.]MCI6504796.1 shikimate kinase [Ruminococcus sp.]MDD5890576.1 shikimate kinase [Ruminococcus sp.]MDD6531273.1 shikimate kinase [Ruminococcus sp.]MDD6710104.1 shikimate kinase [Ruminococcus sp.]